MSLRGIFKFEHPPRNSSSDAPLSPTIAREVNRIHHAVSPSVRNHRVMATFLNRLFAHIPHYSVEKEHLCTSERLTHLDL